MFFACAAHEPLSARSLPRVPGTVDSSDGTHKECHPLYPQPSTYIRYQSQESANPILALGRKQDCVPALEGKLRNESRVEKNLFCGGCFYFNLSDLIFNRTVLSW
jgi:hypothetical protein